MVEIISTILIWFLYGIWSGMVGVWFYKRAQRRADVKFLKEMHVKYPGEPEVYYFAIEASGAEALQELRREVQKHIDQEFAKTESRRQGIPPPPPPPPAPDPLT